LTIGSPLSFRALNDAEEAVHVVGKVVHVLVLQGVMIDVIAMKVVVKVVAALDMSLPVIHNIVSASKAFHAAAPGNSSNDYYYANYLTTLNLISSNRMSELMR
jgi:hypothetical protein